MVFCAVYGCFNNNNKKSKDCKTGCRYFTFPKTKSLCEEWSHKCYQQNKFNTNTARICCDHFTDEDYRLREKILNYPRNKWKLKPNAIPSVNLTKIPKPITSRTQRIKQRSLIRKIHEPRKDPPNMPDVESLVEINVEAINTQQLEKNTDVSTSVSTQTDNFQDVLQKVQILELECERLKGIVQTRETDLKLMEKIFTNGQLRKLKSGKRVIWSVEDIASAISLFAGGPRSYRLLQKRGYPLPGVSTIKNWAAKIDVQPGILHIVLKLMKSSPLPKMQKACVLLFDEMKIQGTYDYDSKPDTTLGPSKYVQVVMARGICGNWKQPIFYNYDSNVTKELLFEIIKKVENVGYPVYAINCDLGGSNRGLWSNLNISENNTSFKNPVNNKNVYVFADAPHMIKLLRNHFIDSGFIINGKIVNTKPVVDLLRNTKNLDLNIAHKINETFLTVKGAQRQKVKLATKLFSNSVSSAVSRLGCLGLYDNENNWLECSDLLKLTNDWFDVFNYKVVESDSRNRMKAYGLALKEQNEILDNMTKTMHSLRKIGSKTLLPFQKGILISINSLKQLFRDLKADFNIKYVLTYHLNQDPLEGFFSIIRSIGGLYDHPSALQFKYRLRNYIMGRNDEVISNSSDVQQELPNMPNIATADIHSGDTYFNNDKDNAEIVTGQLFAPLDIPEVGNEHIDYIPSELTDLEWDGLENLCGYIAIKLKSELGYILDASEVSFSWINHVSEGGQMKPTDDFLKKCRELDLIFNERNRDGLKICSKYITTLLESSAHIDLAEEAKKLFFRCKMYFRIRILNRHLKETSNIRKRKYAKITT